MILFLISFSLSPATRHSTLATPPFSFDHPVRPEQHRLWNVNANLVGGFQIDDKLELRGPLNWQVAWLRALEDFVHVGSDALRPLRSEEHTSELQSRENLVCRLLLEKKKKNNTKQKPQHKKHTKQNNN